MSATLRESLMKLLDRYFTIYDGEVVRAQEGAEAVLDLLRSHPTECAAAIGMECVLARMFPTNDGTATKMIVIQGADSAWIFREEDA